MFITRTSTISGVERTLDINVTDEQLANWKNGAFIQDAMPHLSAEDKEFLKTGITPEEWDTAFKEEDENTIEEDFDDFLFVDHETDDYIG